MTREDAKAIADLRVAISGRTRWEGQPERMDERLLRLLDTAMKSARDLALDMAVGQPGKK